MLDTEFQKLAEKTLDKLADALDDDSCLDVEYQAGVITITIDSGKQFVINKHTPSQQIWLSSPISGGLHFPYDVAEGRWQLADGRRLAEILAAELAILAGIEHILEIEIASALD